MRDEFIHAISTLDARSDRNIRHYFVLTDSIRSAIESKARSQAIVGLKGSGKTTLYRALVEGFAPSSAFMTIGLSATESEFDTYFEKVNCLQFEASVKVGMLLFLLRLVDDRIDEFGGMGSPADWAERKRALLNPRRRIARLLERFQGFSIMGAGLTLRPGERVQTFQPLPRQDVQDILELLRSILTSDRYLRVVIDDPDRLFTKGTTFDPHLLAGYILGTNYISEMIENVQFVHVLKSSVYDQLREVEEMANLPFDYFRYVSWTSSELSEIVRARLEFSRTQPDEIFSDPIEITLPAAINEIRNGPRDLLRFLEVTLKAKSDAMISIDSLRASRGAFREEARRQMESAYTHVYSGIEAFAEAILHEGVEIGVSEFLQKFHELRLSSQPTSVDYGEHWLQRGDRALRALIDAGVVDIRVRGDWVRPYEESYFRFNRKDSTTRLRLNSVFLH
jgi:hypothetical protein